MNNIGGIIVDAVNAVESVVAGLAAEERAVVDLYLGENSGLKMGRKILVGIGSKEPEFLKSSLKREQDEEDQPERGVIHVLGGFH